MKEKRYKTVIWHLRSTLTGFKTLSGLLKRTPTSYLGLGTWYLPLPKFKTLAKVAAPTLYLVLSTWYSLNAQTFKSDAEKAEYYMERTFKVFENKAKYAIYFETVAQQLRKPTDIFTATVYQQHKGGHVYVDKDRYEYNMGIVKIVSDGQLLVYIDELGKQMIIDSARDEHATEEQQMLLFKDLWDNQYGTSSYQYLKIDTLKGKTFHKIKCTMSKNKDMAVFYWIDTKTEQMYMYAEYVEGLYNVYLIQKYGTPPAKHNYGIHLPKTELKTFHGYEVLDHRFLPLRGLRVKSKE